MTDYDAEAILAEFQMFRSVMFDMLDAHDIPLTAPQRRAIHLTIDRAVRESVRAFIVAGKAMRERVAAALAHDLRQPVANVLIGADLILHLAPDHKVAEWARRIVKNGERMRTMLGELLDALAIDANDRLKLTLEPFDMLELVRDVCARARDHQDADIRLDGEPVEGWWSRPALERALDNLLSNAQKYGEPGAPIEVKLGQSIGRAVLSVSNRGKPIPKEETEAIFQQFVRAKDAGASTTGSWGLGLPYVRNVAQSHGGSAVVFSDADVGTVFVIDVPVDARPFRGH